MVAAYKSLSKEKTALEASFSAITSSGDSTHTPYPVNGNNSPSSSSSKVTDELLGKPLPNGNGSVDDNALQVQVGTLMNSLATLSAEKSRMEASFQADKKQLREELTQKDKIIKELQEFVKSSKKNSGVEAENMKSRLIVERHEREKENNNNLVMIRELQKLLSEERHLKENLEMQLDNLKLQFSQEDYNLKADQQIKELSLLLDKERSKVVQLETQLRRENKESSSDNETMRKDMKKINEKHMVAIHKEQLRNQALEDRCRKMADLHEDRVASLESRLAELSNTIGSYDRLRQMDQETIVKLKDRVAQLQQTSIIAEETTTAFNDVNTIVNEILRLKNQLIVLNAKDSHPKELEKVFDLGGDNRSHCEEEMQRLQNELESLRLDRETMQTTLHSEKRHIQMLQDKIKSLSNRIELQEEQLRAVTDEHYKELKAEKNRSNDAIAAINNEFQLKINNLELQLHKQRDRSLQMLEEKDNEIKSLKLPSDVGPSTLIPNKDEQLVMRKISSSQVDKYMSNLVSESSNDNFHILHYINEMARKDVEISMLRKAKHSAESLLRQALQDKVTAQEELSDKINNLEEEVAQ